MLMQKLKIKTRQRRSLRFQLPPPFPRHYAKPIAQWSWILERKWGTEERERASTRGRMKEKKDTQSKVTAVWHVRGGYCHVPTKTCESIHHCPIYPRDSHVILPLSSKPPTFHQTRFGNINHTSGHFEINWKSQRNFREQSLNFC